MRLARWLPWVVPVAALASCGSRTGLLVSDGDPVGPQADAAVQVKPDAAPPSACADAGTQVFYVITESKNLVEFDPPSNTFRTIGAIQCPGVLDEIPFSMAVDRSGNAYAVYQSTRPDAGSEIFFFELRPSASGVACTRVAFSAGDAGVAPTFGMGFSGDAVGGGETLYIAGAAPPYMLARVPIPGFTAQPIGALSGLVQPELTGTGAGDLFGFSGAQCSDAGPCPGFQCATSSIAQIDKTTGKVLGLDLLANFPQGNGWAFGFWGGVFYIFTAPQTNCMFATTSLVTRFDPATQTRQQVNTYPEVIVGAGVSTCAPLERP
jgi:hypothetical protein